MELVLIGVAGCSAIDMISILKKKQRQEITFKAEWERWPSRTKTI
jgi:putative redox protein